MNTYYIRDVENPGIVYDYPTRVIVQAESKEEALITVGRGHFSGIDTVDIPDTANGYSTWLEVFTMKPKETKHRSKEWNESSYYTGILFTKTTEEERWEMWETPCSHERFPNGLTLDDDCDCGMHGYKYEGITLNNIWFGGKKQ